MVLHPNERAFHTSHSPGLDHHPASDLEGPIGMWLWLTVLRRMSDPFDLLVRNDGRSGPGPNQIHYVGNMQDLEALHQWEPDEDIAWKERSQQLDFAVSPLA